MDASAVNLGKLVSARRGEVPPTLYKSCKGQTPS